MRQRLAWRSARALASAPMRGYWARWVTPLIPNSAQAERRRLASSASGQTISGFQEPYAADLAGCSKGLRSLSDFIGQGREKLSDGNQESGDSPQRWYEKAGLLGGMR